MQEDVNVAAQQASHSGATKERMYGVSTGYLGRLSENLIEPYANASTEWQVLMKVPEGGKMSIYTSTRTKNYEHLYYHLTSLLHSISTRNLKDLQKKPPVVIVIVNSTLHCKKHTLLHPQMPIYLFHLLLYHQLPYFIDQKSLKIHSLPISSAIL